jgi:transcriptional antiterminator NusG
LEQAMARWYIIHAYSGFENKVREAILAEAERLGLSQLVEGRGADRDRDRSRRGKKVQVERKILSGLCARQAGMNDDVYHLVKNTPKVTGFLGSQRQAAADQRGRGRAHPQRKEEAAAAAPKINTVDYEIGDQVKVLDGPFASFNGEVEELDFDKNRVKVSVSIFGRATPVELDFEQVELVK